MLFDVKSDIFLAILKGVIVEDTLKAKVEGKSQEYLDGYQRGISICTEAMTKGMQYLQQASEHEEEPKWNQTLN